MAMPQRTWVVTSGAPSGGGGSGTNATAIAEMAENKASNPPKTSIESRAHLCLRKMEIPVATPQPASATKNTAVAIATSLNGIGDAAAFGGGEKNAENSIRPASSSVALLPRRAITALARIAIALGISNNRISLVSSATQCRRPGSGTEQAPALPVLIHA